MKFSIEEKIITENKNIIKLKKYLLSSVDKLTKAGADLIILPCNTAHIFEFEIKKYSKAKFLSIIDSTINIVKIKGFKKVALIATGQTIKSRIYQNKALKFGVNIIYPEAKDQKIINIIINNLLQQRVIKNLNELNNIIINLQSIGAEAIILGCSDLYQLINKENTEIPIIDSTKALIDETLKELTKR